MIKRPDLAHLKWSLINNRGFSREKADEHIRELIILERASRLALKRIKRDTKKDFKEEFRRLKNA